MKLNLLSLLTCAAGLALCPVLHAQDAAPAPATTGTDSGGTFKHHGHGGNPDMMLQRMTTQLGLTSDQQAQIKPILEAAHTQMQSVRGDNSLTQQEKMAKGKETWDAANSQIEGILTPDQKTKFDAMKEKMHKHRHGGAEANADASPSASPSATP